MQFLRRDHALRTGLCNSIDRVSRALVLSNQTDCLCHVTSQLWCCSVIRFTFLKPDCSTRTSTLGRKFGRAHHGERRTESSPDHRLLLRDRITDRSDARERWEKTLPWWVHRSPSRRLVAYFSCTIGSAGHDCIVNKSCYQMCFYAE